MILAKTQIEQLQTAAQPLMVFLSNAEIFHPHFTVIVTSERAEIVEGCASVLKQPTLDTSDLHVCHECDGTGLRA